MTYVPMKSVPLIIEERDYTATLDQLVMIEEKMPAMELFGFPKRNANTAQIAQRTATNLRTATTNWTHAMSKATNDCVSQLFKANKNRVALLSGALKRYQDEAKKCKKEIDNRQNPPEKKKEYEEQYVQLLEKIDGTKKLILEAKESGAAQYTGAQEISSFVGNVLLKVTEGVAKSFAEELKRMFLKSAKTKVGYLMIKGGVDELRRKMDYTEYGGAPLMGISKPVIKAHGSSNAKAIKNAIRQAKLYSETGVIDDIRAALEAEKARQKAAQAEGEESHA